MLGQDSGCCLNSKLLQYFILKEFTEKDEAQPVADASKEEDPSQVQGAYQMKITKCPHTGRKHYAKNMCSSCYRKFGRNQLAWKCEHGDRLNYSICMCQTCYLSDYHKRRTMKAKDKKSIESVSMTSLERINEELDAAYLN